MGFGLTKEEVENAKIDKYIVDRARAVINQLKRCRSEFERLDYHLVLAALAPERTAAGNLEGMIAKVTKRLGVTRGARYIKSTGEKRERAFDKAVTQRGQYDEAAAMSGQLKPGDAATSRGRPCTVVEIDYKADTCKLAFSAGGIEVSRDFTCISKGIDPPPKARFPMGSARLQRAPPSLQSKGRETRSDEIAEKARPKVKELFDSEGARSPSQRDGVRRRLGVGIYETAQALYIYTKFATLYKLFCSRFPDIKLSFSAFKKLRPWYIRRQKQVTCQCKHCVNYKNYMEVLQSLVKLFDPVVQPPTMETCVDCDDEAGSGQPGEQRVVDDEGEREIDSWAGKAKLLELLQLCGLQSKSEQCKSVLCGGAFDGAGLEDCINCKCQKCGFSQLWSKGLRPHVVDQHGNVKSTAPVEFQSSLKCIRIRSSKTNEPGEAKQPSYQSHTGTVVQFLDEFERDVFKKFPHHRFTIMRQKAMAAEFERCRGPGWIQSDVDFMMDGEILPPAGESIQSDHWSPMTYTGFIQVLSWIPRAAWTSRSSELKLGAFVTVEPVERSVAGSIEPAEGSFGAEVVQLPRCSAGVEPQRCLYGIRRFGASAAAPPEMWERQFLRDRQRHTKAFVHISDDKTHDSQVESPSRPGTATLAAAQPPSRPRSRHTPPAMHPLPHHAPLDAHRWPHTAGHAMNRCPRAAAHASLPTRRCRCSHAAGWPTHR